MLIDMLEEAVTVDRGLIEELDDEVPLVGLDEYLRTILGIQWMKEKE